MRWPYEGPGQLYEGDIESLNCLCPTFETDTMDPKDLKDQTDPTDPTFAGSTHP